MRGLKLCGFVDEVECLVKLASNHCPEYEGIETSSQRMRACSTTSSNASNHCPEYEGIETSAARIWATISFLTSNHCPEYEGIETEPDSPAWG